jgi:hypothetical protein
MDCSENCISCNDYDKCIECDLKNGSIVNYKGKCFNKCALDRVDLWLSN